MAAPSFKICECFNALDFELLPRGDIVIEEGAGLSVWSPVGPYPIRRGMFLNGGPSNQLRVSPDGAAWLVSEKEGAIRLAPDGSEVTLSALRDTSIRWISADSYVRGYGEGTDVLAVDLAEATVQVRHHSEMRSGDIQVIGKSLWTYSDAPATLRVFSHDLSEVQEYPVSFAENSGIGEWCSCNEFLAMSHYEELPDGETKSWISIFNTRDRSWASLRKITDDDAARHIHRDEKRGEFYLCGSRRFVIVEAHTGNLKFSVCPTSYERLAEPDTTYVGAYYGFRLGAWVCVTSSVFPTVELYDAVTGALVEEVEWPQVDAPYSSGQFLLSPRQPLYLDEGGVVIGLRAGHFATALACVRIDEDEDRPRFSFAPRIPVTVERLTDSDGTSSYRISVNHDDGELVLRYAPIYLGELADAVGRGFLDENSRSDQQFGGTLELVLDKKKTPKNLLPTFQRMVKNVEGALRTSVRANRGRNRELRVTLKLQ